MPKVLGKLNRAKIQLASDPRLAVLDEVIELVAGADYLNLTPHQKVAQLVLLYDNEVCNGGHLQYFHNQGADYVKELLWALKKIGAACQRENLERASQYALSHPVKRARTLQEYSEWAHKREFERYDSAYYACRPAICDDLLPACIEAHLGEFIEFE